MCCLEVVNVGPLLCPLRLAVLSFFWSMSRMKTNKACRSLVDNSFNVHE